MMQNTHLGPNQTAYRPTSLDFINRPNPVEPNTDPHRHPLHADQSHLRLLHDANVSNLGAIVANAGSGDPPRKRRKSGDGSVHDADRPTLPAVRQQGEKRLRIPPTLSGLHQPPPDAGILPSISVDRLRKAALPERTVATLPSANATKPASDVQRAVALPDQQFSTGRHRDQEGGSSETAAASSDDKRTKPRKNRKWTEIETEYLLKGVAKYGIGKWTTILKDPDLSFEDRRRALDLKDRFRICCPDQYKKLQRSDAVVPAGALPSKQAEHTASKPKRTRTTHRKTAADLNDLGIAATFIKSTRRKRTGYSEAEDNAILEGFRKHGPKWSKIQQDVSLRLESRMPMDLKDRMRTKWPGVYTEAGLLLRAGGSSTAKARGATNVRHGAGQAKHDEIDEARPPSSSSRIVAISTDKTDIPRSEKDNKDPSYGGTQSKKNNAPFLSQADDVFWGLPLDADEARVTLDRRILDWPSNPTAYSCATDSLQSLNLPRPNAPPTTTSGPAASFQLPSSVAAAAAAASLPSLATITAGSMSFDLAEQLELPSLLEGFGTLDGECSDTRPGAQLMMPSLDEVLG